jgi:hypothetical protein
MSITIEIDPALLKTAEELTDIHDPTALMKHLLEKEIRARTSADFFASLGGSMPDLEIPPRMRPGTELR